MLIKYYLWRTQEVKFLCYLKGQNNGNNCQLRVIHYAEEAPSGHAAAPTCLCMFYKAAPTQGQNH